MASLKSLTQQIFGSLSADEKKPYKTGDFTGLAEDYSRHRPDYCRSIASGLLGLLEKPMHEIDFVDVGAGTGIWSRLIYEKGVHSVTAIEPNDDMRNVGVEDTAHMTIRWVSGSAEKTGLSKGCCDFLTMASSFHWTNFDYATREFHRVLRPGGRFAALWNPRFIEANPLLVEIESYANTLCPNMERVSSGRSGITVRLTERLLESPFFEDVVYMEGRHVIQMTPERYIGAWRSVNDMQVQLGPEKFNRFLEFVRHRISTLKSIESTYLTRSWSARRRDS